MRVLLIHTADGARNLTPYLGLGYLSSYLRAAGHRTRIVEIPSLQGRDIEEIAREFGPEAIGLSVWCRGFRNAAACARRLAVAFPDAVRVAGGPLASFIPDELLAEDLFQYVIAGPGEIAFSQLLREIEEGCPRPGARIQGVYFRGHQKGREFGAQVPDLDALPFPERDPDSRFAYPVVLLMNRGCDGRCIFCVNPAMTAVRSRSVENVMAECEFLQNLFHHEELLFVDDNFALFPSQAESLCRRLRSGTPRAWSAQIRADIDPAMLELMREAGCGMIGMGVESGNEAVLKSLGKRIDLRRVDATVGRAARLGLHVSLCYMLGHYSDTPETMGDTIRHAARMVGEHGASILLYCNTLYPGSAQHRARERLGLRLHAREWDDYNAGVPTVSGRAFTLDDLRRRYFEGLELLSGN